MSHLSILIYAFLDTKTAHKKCGQRVLDSFVEEGGPLFDVEWFALFCFDFESVFLGEADQDVVVCFCEVVDDTVYVRFDVLWTLDK